MYFLIWCIVIFLMTLLARVLLKTYESFEQINKCAFIIPLHPKHYQHGYSILNEISDSDADVYFVFTTVEEKDLFEKGLNTSNSFHYIIFTDFTPVESIDINSIVTIKKWYALSRLYDKYDYLCAIDSEISFLKKTGFYDMMRDVSNQKKIFGGMLNPSALREQNIVKDSLTKLTPIKDHARLKEISKDFMVFTWWSNPAVYVGKDIPDFFKWIDFKKETLDRLVWNVFDDMVYNFYCILYKNYNLIIVPGLIQSLESSNSDMIELTNHKLGNTYWVNNKAYSQNKSYYENSHFYIRFHVDRI